MTKLKAPRFLDVIDAVAQAGAVRVTDIAEATGCDYGPARRVLDLLADEGLILKVMRGERTFEYTLTDDISPEPIEVEAFAIVDAVNEQEEIIGEIAPAVEDLGASVDAAYPRLGLGDRAEDYPEEWLDAGRKSIETADDDLNIWIVRKRGQRLGEIAEMVIGERIVYQVVSPWEPKTFDRMSLAIAALD